MKRIAQSVLFAVLAVPELIAGCPAIPPINLPATRGAMLNPNGMPVASAQLKFFYTKEASPNSFRQVGNTAAATVSTDNQGTFDFSSLTGGVYLLTIKQKKFPPRTVLLRLPAKVVPPNKREIWIKLAPNECDGVFVYVPNQ